MGTVWLKAAVRRCAMSGGLLLVVLAAAPAAAMDVRVEYGGPAHTESEVRDMVLSAITRDVLGHPPAGWSHVVFFRPQARGATPIDLHGDDANLGAIPAGSYVVVAVPAGAHRFHAGDDAGTPLALQVLPGRAYFVRAVDGPQGAVQLRRADVTAFDRASRVAGL